MFTVLRAGDSCVSAIRFTLKAKPGKFIVLIGLNQQQSKYNLFLSLTHRFF